MTVERYLFQSPSSSQVQIGRPDPSVKKEDSSVKTSGESIPNTLEQKAQTFEAAQVKEVEPTVEPNRLLDIYV